jgi:hypothetical protein
MVIFHSYVSLPEVSYDDFVRHDKSAFRLQRGFQQDDRHGKTSLLNWGFPLS